MERWQSLAKLTCLKINHLFYAEDFKIRFAFLRIHKSHSAICRPEVDTNNVATDSTFKGRVKLRERFLLIYHSLKIHDFELVKLRASVMAAGSMS